MKNTLLRYTQRPSRLALGCRLHKPSYLLRPASVATLLVGTGAALLAARSAQAQTTLTWNAGTNVWDNGATQDWNGFTSVWTNGDKAEFVPPAASVSQTMPQTVTVTGAISATGLQFDAGAGAFNFAPAAAGTNALTIRAAADGTGSGGYLLSEGSFANFATGLASFTVGPTAAAGDSVSEGTTPATDGILIGATLNHTDFVKSDTAGALVPATYVTTVSAGENVNMTGSLTSSASISLNSLRFNSAGAFNLTNTGTLTISSGMILQTASTGGTAGGTTGGNVSSVTGGTVVAPSGGQLLLDTENTNTSSALSILANVGGGTAATDNFGITKVGAGIANINSATGGSTYAFSGPSYVLGGTLNIGNNIAGSAYTGTGSFFLATGATLSFRFGTPSSAQPSFTAVPGLISGAGNFTVNNPAIENSTTLSNTANTYSGITTINNGGLQAYTLSNIGTASSIGTGIATSTATNAASLVFAGTTSTLLISGGTTGAAQSTDRLFTLASGANGTIYVGNPIFSLAGAAHFTNTNALAFTPTATGGTTFVNAGLTLSGYNTFANTFAPLIGNPSASTTTSLTKADVGTWTLTNANTYGARQTIWAATCGCRASTRWRQPRAATG